tara:strand:+ start:348 stop:767 length:420 start_codon:yes stop_codon:yes gene_type:complete
MNTKQTVLNKLKNSKLKLSKKVDLGLIDEFNYDFMNLEDEISTLSYLAYEWHDEAFEEYRQAWMKLNDEYTHNGSSVIRYADLERDEQLLVEIAQKAEELGLAPSEVYDDYDEHYRVIQEMKETDKQYEANEREFRDWS